MGEAVDLAPGHLLGQEPGDAGLAQNLGQGRAVAEHVGEPKVGGLPPQLVDEEALPVNDLTHQRFTRGDVAVRLHPHAAHGLELTALDLLADALVQARVAVLDPAVLLGLGAGEAVLGVLVHEPHRVGEGAGALAGRLPQRPQPGRVDVGVAHGADAMGAGHRRAGQRRRQRGPGPSRAGGHVGDVEGVARRGQGTQDVVRTGLVGRELVQELNQHEHVVEQSLDLPADHGQLGLPQPVEGRTVHVGHEQGPAQRPPGRDGVGRGLHVQLDRLPARRRAGEEVLAMAEVDALHGHIALPHQALRREAHHSQAAQVQEGDHLGSGPGLGDPAPHPEPCGVPGPAPGPAHGEGLVVAAVGLLGGDGLAPHVVGRHLQGGALAVNGRPHQLPEGLVDARPGYSGDAAILQHDRVPPPDGSHGRRASLR